MAPHAMKTLIVLFLFAAPAALAEPPSVSAAGIACNPAGTQQEMNVCAADEHTRADAGLNAVYGELVALLADDPLALQRLRTAQRAWIAFRDAEVAAQLPVPDGEDPRIHHGSMYPLLYHGAMARLSRDRTTQLWLRLEELGGR